MLHLCKWVVHVGVGCMCRKTVKKWLATFSSYHRKKKESAHACREIYVLHPFQKFNFANASTIVFFFVFFIFLEDDRVFF